MSKLMRIDVRGVDTMRATLFFCPTLHIPLRVYVQEKMDWGFGRRTPYVEAIKDKVNQHNFILR